MQNVHTSEPDPVAAAFAEAAGRTTGHHPVLAGTGGPAGNAILTAWTGLVLLVLAVSELLTLVDVRGLLSWHVAIGSLLLPAAVLKTGSTGWRLVRYYLGNEPYREAGPPPLLFRLLGPLVVVFTLSLLGSGVLLIVLGEQSSRQELATLVGFRVDWITVHQAAFAAWAAVTGVHLLGRIVPALTLTFRGRGRGKVPGGRARTGLVGVAAALAVTLAVLLVQADGTWAHDDVRHGAPRGGARP